MSTNFDLDLLNEEIESAPKAGFGPRVTFGKLTLADIQIMAWEGKRGETRTPKPRPFVKGDKANKEKGEYLQFTFNIDVQEINPTAKQNDWEWNRRVDMKDSSEDGKTKTDWSVYVRASLESVIGKDWAKKLQKGVYVEVDEPETVARDKQGNVKGWTDSEGNFRTNTSFRVLRVFKSKTECEAARNERFAKKDDDSGESADGIPQSVINDVKGMITAGLDDDSMQEILSQAPYDQYDYDTLIAAAS